MLKQMSSGGFSLDGNIRGNVSGGYIRLQVLHRLLLSKITRSSVTWKQTYLRGTA